MFQSSEQGNFLETNFEVIAEFLDDYKKHILGIYFYLWTINRFTADNC